MIVAQLPNRTHSAAEHHKALEDMYEALGGTEWVEQGNWLSDKPIYEWKYINHTDYTDITNGIDLSTLLNSDRVLSLVFDDGNNNVQGMLPESFTTIMDDAIYMDLSYIGGIKGKVPYAITHHPKWEKAGWTFISQRHYDGADIDFDDINLHLPNDEVWDLVTGKKVNTSDVLKKHKLTLVLNVGYYLTDEYIDQNFDKTANKYLDYAPKGLGLVLCPESYNKEDCDLQKYKHIIDNLRTLGLPEDIEWTNTFSNVTGIGSWRKVGNMALLDNEGNLLWFGDRDYEGGNPNHFPFSYYTDAIDAVCRKYLGEPVEHPQFSLNNYTSTDFSQDGEVVQLQKATEGNGIDIVLLGNAYDDRDMDSDVTEGRYLQDMRNAMENLFAYDEIMKKLRNRFNVYTVKVVSLNNINYKGGDYRILDQSDAWEYAGKIPGLDPEKVHIGIIYRSDGESPWGQSWYTEKGGSVAAIYGGPTHVVTHEVIGHGVGKLLDEYLFDKDSDLKLSESEVEEMREWMKTEYYDKGWGMNLSTYKEPEKSPWAWMFEDPDYASEVGMYQGAWLYPYDLWRPSETSMMNNDDGDFTLNAPSREAIYKQVMQASEGEGWVYDREAFKAFDKAPVPASRSAAVPALKDSSDKIYIHKVPKIMKKDAEGRYISEPFDRSFIKSAPASRAADVDSTDADSMPFSIYVTPDGKRHVVTTPRK